MIFICVSAIAMAKICYLCISKWVFAVDFYQRITYYVNIR